MVDVGGIPAAAGRTRSRCVDADRQPGVLRAPGRLMRARSPTLCHPRRRGPGTKSSRCENARGRRHPPGPGHVDARKAAPRSGAQGRAHAGPHGMDAGVSFERGPRGHACSAVSPRRPASDEVIRLRGCDRRYPAASGAADRQSGGLRHRLHLAAHREEDDLSDRGPCSVMDQ